MSTNPPRSARVVLRRLQAEKRLTIASAAAAIAQPDGPLLVTQQQGEAMLAQMDAYFAGEIAEALIAVQAEAATAKRLRAEDELRQVLEGAA